MESKTIKIVPETLEDITAEWCEKILHEGGTISKETKVCTYAFVMYQF